MIGLDRAHAVEALNFNPAWLIYGFVAAMLAILLIGIPILIALGIAYVVLVVVAGSGPATASTTATR